MQRELSDADRDTWASYASSVAPMRGRTRFAAPSVGDASAAVPVRRETGLPRIRPLDPAVVIGAHPPGVDRATWQKFRTAKMAAARRLDLHGYTAQRAFHSLLAFLRGAHADGLRCVEVVTGRGAGEIGVIRRELPIWLNLPELRPLVLAAVHPHSSNPGAVRVLMRRLR